MKFNIVKKKASSLRELGHETIELKEIQTLNDLLYSISYYEYKKQCNVQLKPYKKEEIQALSNLGKITFENYNEQGNFNQAINTMIQDFKDGLFRVYLNENECTDLNERLTLKEENDVVFIKLVMLAGRLW